jgi:hypothetical protein
MGARKQNMDAGALSRAPVNRATAGDELGEGLPSFPVKIALLSLTRLDVPTDDASVDPALEKIKRAAAAPDDPVLKKLRGQIVTGFPNDKCNLDLDLHTYWNVKERFAIDKSDGMVVVGPRVVFCNRFAPTFYGTECRCTKARRKLVNALACQLAQY